MKKMLYVAAREFRATVMAKGFLIGILITPAIVVVSIFLIPRLVSRNPPRIDGQVSIVDPTGEVAAGLAAYLAPEQIVQRRAQARNRLKKLASADVGESAATDAMLGNSVRETIEEAPRIVLVPLTRDADLEREKSFLKMPPAEKGQGPARLALIIVHPDAVRRASGRAEFGTYDLFVRGKLDDRFADEVHAGLQSTIGAARLRAAGFNPEMVETLARVERSRSRVITAEGEQKSSRVLNSILPIAFMILLLISVLTSASSLLTTTIEEKSNRIVELLLSAVSAMELMTGKILGQMAVGLLILVLYAGLGVVALASFALSGLLDPLLLVYLLVFFILSYFTVAALMAAVGSAVSDLRDAQSLMTPIMVIFMLPWLLMAPIGSQPNSMLAIVLSFVPPIGNFVMLLRLATSTPPPAWQVGLAMLLSLAGAYAALRFAAKVFRIGLLMFGKPPTLATLLRWAKAAQ